MDLKEISNKMVFRRDNEYGTYYTLGLSKKLDDDTYENGYIDCRFRKEVELDNMTKINIKDAWLSFYTKETAEGYKRTIPYIFINEFELADDMTDDDFEKSEALSDADAEQLEIDVDDLPF